MYLVGHTYNGIYASFMELGGGATAFRGMIRLYRNLHSGNSVHVMMVISSKFCFVSEYNFLGSI